MKYVFFSTPMHGLDEKEIKEKFKQLVERLPEEYVVIDNYHKPDIPVFTDYDSVRIWMLGDSISKMARADLVIFSPDWSNSEGCKIEMNVAIAYHKKILVLPEGRKKN